MKIEVDLKDIFIDEDGNPDETVEESLKRQVVDVLLQRASKGLTATIDRQVAQKIDELISEAVEGKMPGIVDDIMNVVYTPVGTYGERGEPTTFRDQLVKTIGEKMQYKSERYDSDKTPFTKAVDAAIEVQSAQFKKDFDAIVNDKFRKEALDYAVSKLQKALGLTAK